VTVRVTVLGDEPHEGKLVGVMDPLTFELPSVNVRTIAEELGLQVKESLAVPCPPASKLIVRGLVRHVALGWVLEARPTAR
jgi:hypothetical protein